METKPADSAAGEIALCLAKRTGPHHRVAGRKTTGQFSVEEIEALLANLF